jgi:hypothetical protein|tara:strand:+ start:4374 stop:5060 length:687 start_codon:yes stop_codon:yes gene_type:complete
MSNYTKTTNFLAKDSLPDSDTAKIIRGSEFDTEFNNLVTAVASKANTLSPALSGIPTTPTAAAGTNTLQIASTAFALANGIPVGGIIMWSGTIATIPTGWALCNGGSGTPDLRNRFIIGAHSDTSSIAKTTVTGAATQSGGSKDAVVVSHTHTASAVAIGDHVHMQSGQTIGPGAGGFAFNSGGGANNTLNTAGAGGHTHTINVVTTGVSGTNQNLPPYYALAYIMKT